MSSYTPRGKPGSERHPQMSGIGGVSFSLRAEEEIRGLISGRAPLPEILNRICGALDCAIGNVVSLISLPGDDIEEFAIRAETAKTFGLHVFYLSGVVGATGEIVGYLGMYCCDPRSASISESQAIERAVCLAGFAVDHYNELYGNRARPESEQSTSSAFVPKWPLFTN